MQHVAQGPAAHLGGVRRAEHGDGLVDEPEPVLGEDAEGIADRVVEPGFAEVELDVPDVLVRLRGVEPAAGEKDRLGRVFARASGRARRRCGRDRSGARLGRRFRGRRGLGLVQFLGKLLDQPRGFLAAGRAQVQALLFLQDDRVGVIGAVVAALAAILLRHRGHEARGERLARGERHALVERPWPDRAREPRRCWRAPGRRRSDAGDESRRLAAAQRRDADRVRRDGRRQEPREPGALFGGERRVLGDHEAGRGVA